MEDEQITSFLELETHRIQINALQEELTKVQSLLEVKERKNHQLEEEVTQLKLFIADHCISQQKHSKTKKYT